MSEYVQVTTATETADQARHIARLLVEQRLAACVQVLGPVESTYRWRDAVTAAGEWLCFAKTRRDRFAEVSCAIRGAHPYEVPEIVATPIVAGSAAYLDWMDTELAER